MESSLRLRYLSLDSEACGQLDCTQASLISEYLPISEAGDTLGKISPCLEFGVYYCFDIDFGQAMADESSEMLWKASKGVVTALWICVRIWSDMVGD